MYLGVTRVVVCEDSSSFLSPITLYVFVVIIYSEHSADDPTGIYYPPGLQPPGNKGTLTALTGCAKQVREVRARWRWSTPLTLYNLGDDDHTVRNM
jgi:hypothetical protein